MANNAESNREARRCIQGALVNLLQTKRYESIRMTDIIRKSGVSRACVYKNYKSKDEIMRDLYVKPMEEAFAATNGSLEAIIDWLFQTAFQHKKSIQTLIDAELSHDLLAILNERSESASGSFYALLWNGMLHNSVIEWVKSGTDESAESAAARLKADLLKLAASIGDSLLAGGRDSRPT